MTTEELKITFVGMEPTEPLKKYVIDKINKYDHLLDEAISGDVVLKEYINRKGVKNDFRVDITIILPNSAVRVEVSGENMYANIDEASDTLARRLKRYTDKKAYWEGITPWKVLEADSMLKDIDEKVDTYEDYVPSIKIRKRLEDMSPLEEGEAIERMELLGYDQLLFRSKSSGKISMIYRRKDGGYGLVEPADTDI